MFAAPLLLLLASHLAATAGFVPHQPTPPRGLRDGLAASANPNSSDADFRVVVVGKLILDKYGDPTIQNDDAQVTIGGGGPQAAWGACAALAVRDVLHWSGGMWEPVDDEQRDETPPKQPVALLLPVGLKNWTPQMTESLNSLLPMLHSPPTLVGSDEHITPTINIWHDAHEIVNWQPVDGSFGEQGAGGLWRNRPCADDILDSIEGYEGDVILHAILESGSTPTGGGMDALPFVDPALMGRVAAAGVEPIVFPNDETGEVSSEDAGGVSSLIGRIEASLSASCDASEGKKQLLVSPDRPCYAALQELADVAHREGTEFAVRDGANGSFVNGAFVPPAVLATPDGAPLNPTGAGNAYAGAFSACRASGSLSKEAAVLANAVGGAVCEYENLPEWSWEVLERIAAAACEIESQMQREPSAVGRGTATAPKQVHNA